MSEKRNKLEQLATDTVQRIGINSLSFRTLAEDAGIKSSSVHYYFPEKTHLTNAIIEKYTQDFSENLNQISQKHTQPAKRLAAFVKIFEQVISDDKLCLCGMMAAEIGNLKNDSRQLLNVFFNQAEDWLYQIIEENKDQLTIDLKPRQLSRIIMSGLEGAILIDRASEKSERLQAQRAFIKKLFA